MSRPLGLGVCQDLVLARVHLSQAWMFDVWVFCKTWAGKEQSRLHSAWSWQRWLPRLVLDLLSISSLELDRKLHVLFQLFHFSEVNESCGGVTKTMKFAERSHLAIEKFLPSVAHEILGRPMPLKHQSISYLSTTLLCQKTAIFKALKSSQKYRM